jgi:hypothetical protein
MEGPKPELDVGRGNYRNLAAKRKPPLIAAR